MATEAQPRQRTPFSADEEAIKSATSDHGGVEASQLDVQNAGGKAKCWGSGFHYRKISNAPDDGWLPGLIKRAGFGSQEFKEFLCHAAKDLTEIHHHHQPHDHTHGTRDKEIFGFEDASVHAREHDNLFGMRDMEYQEKANTLFGFEDVEFERGESGA